jgi:PAS domain S-box-containing protein
MFRLFNILGRKTDNSSENGEKPRVHRSILHRVVTQSLLVSAFTIILLSTLSFIIARSLTTQQQVFEQLSTVASDKKDYLEGRVQEYREQTSLLAKEDHVQAAFDGQSATLAEIFVELQREQSVTGITLYKTDKTLVAVQGKKSPAFFVQGDQTIVIPTVDRKEGFTALIVYAPVRNADGELIGFVAVQYDTALLLRSLFADITSALGKTADITLARLQGNEIFVVHHSRNEPLRSYPVGTLEQQYVENTPLALAVQGMEGVKNARDETGKDVVVSYRFLPSLGWGMVVKVESDEAFARIAQLALALGAISIVLLALSGVFGFVFARNLTGPLLQLAENIRVLKPGHWNFSRSIHTGDEVELLDQVIADLASRLKTSYDHLEEQVTERTMELKKQYTFDRAILEGIQHGVIAVDPHGTVTTMNTAALNILGVPSNECTGKSIVDVLPLHRQRLDYTAENHPVVQCLKDRTAFRASPTMHMSILRKDQTLLPVMLAVSPLEQEGTLMGAIAIFLDVTEERQTDYMKSEFISLASHQLRTPLSSMRWYMELLTDDKEHPLGEEQMSYVKEIEQASSRMANLLDTLLRVAHLDDKGMSIERREVNVVEVITHTTEELQAAAKDEQISLRMNMPPAPLMVSTDPVLLSIVMQNLIGNAIKYSPKGKAESIEISLEEKDGHIEIHVKDRGMGIPESEKARVFTKFFRAKNIQSLSVDGSGLGLYLTKRIVENLGGKISFESIEGKGTTFTVVFSKDL